MQSVKAQVKKSTLSFITLLILRLLEKGKNMFPFTYVLHNSGKTKSIVADQVNVQFPRLCSDVENELRMN